MTLSAPVDPGPIDAFVLPLEGATAQNAQSWSAQGPQSLPAPGGSNTLEADLEFAADGAHVLFLTVDLDGGAAPRGGMVLVDGEPAAWIALDAAGQGRGWIEAPAGAATISFLHDGGASPVGVELRAEAAGRTRIGSDDADEIRGGKGADLIHGAGGDDILRGWGGADDLSGGAGSDRLFGNAGDDMLRAGGGIDSLTGGQGGDHFIFSDRDGFDRIMDFEDGIDRIDLTPVGLSGFDELEITAAANGARIAYGDSGRVLVRDMDVSDIDAEDFVF